MRRRQFITLLGGAAAWPVAARAQQATGFVIGYLSGGGPAQNTEWVAAFVQRLGELGWIEGRNISIEYRWGEGRAGRYTEFAAELVRSNVKVIVTQATAPVIAARHATSVIPIVFVGTGDPVGAGLVASLNRPGGNVTGLSLQNPELAGKRLEILREVAPNLRRFAVLLDMDNPGTPTTIDEVQAAAQILGLDVMRLELRGPEEIASAFASISGQADALFVAGGPFAVNNRIQINALAVSARLPAIYYTREYVEGGGLISYGPNLPDLYRRAGDFVDKLLRGTKPSDIPVEQPTKFELAVNLKAAKTLGLTIPPTLLATADEVIE
jgi:putative tryptophan/tyrosine transport system substrate-binding protein